MELAEKYKASQISLYILIWTIYKIYLSKQLLIKFVWIMELAEKYKASQISLYILIWTIYKTIFAKAVADKICMDHGTWWKV